MGMPHAQRGMSLFGIMLILICIGTIALVGLKIGPLYMEWGKVTNSLESVVQELATKKATKQDIINMLERRFQINDVSSVDLKNKEHVVIKRVKGGKMQITIAYEARAPLFKNLSAVASFEKTVEAGTGN